MRRERQIKKIVIEREREIDREKEKKTNRKERVKERRALALAAKHRTQVLTISSAPKLLDPISDAIFRLQ